MTTKTTGEASTDQPVLGRSVGEVMAPGCITVPANATVATAAAALEAHGVHAVLVVDPTECVPIGWITARGLIRGVKDGRRQGLAEGVIDEGITAIGRERSVKVARYALSFEGVTRLLVRSPGEVAPEGVVTERDIAHATLWAESGPVDA